MNSYILVYHVFNGHNKTLSANLNISNPFNLTKSPWNFDFQYQGPQINVTDNFIVSNFFVVFHFLSSQKIDQLLCLTCQTKYELHLSGYQNVHFCSSCSLGNHQNFLILQNESSTSIYTFHLHWLPRRQRNYLAMKYSSVLTVSIPKKCDF